MSKAPQQALLASVSLVIASLVIASLVTASLVTGATAAGAAPAAAPKQRTADPVYALDRAGALRPRGAVGLRTFVADNGRTYQASPPLVEGANGTAYFGEEFDAACAFGARFARGLRRLARLARMIEASGRTVMFTVAPNKTAVNKADLAGAALPHGSCDARGLARQDRALDRFADRNYLPMRRRLAADAARGVDTYWRVDTHWTSVGATQWAHAVAERLDPTVARRQSYRRDTETLRVDLSFLGLVGEVIEKARGRVTTTRVKASPKPGANAFDPDLPSPTIGWTSSPRQRTWPGRTLLLGDSFTYRSMEPLMPLFANGDFQWIGNTPRPDLVDAVARADTVVIEVVQRYLAGTVINTGLFHREVRKALARHPR